MRLDKTAEQPDPRCDIAVVTFNGQAVTDWDVADDERGVLIKYFRTDDGDTIRTSQLCGEVQIVLPA